MVYLYYSTNKLMATLKPKGTQQAIADLNHAYDYDRSVSLVLSFSV